MAGVKSLDPTMNRIHYAFDGFHCCSNRCSVWSNQCFLRQLPSAQPPPRPCPQPRIPMLNLTIPAGHIDPRFRAALISHGDNEYDDDSGLMAMAIMLHRLSLYDFITGMVEPQTYVAEGFPDVSVSIRGRPGATPGDDEQIGTAGAGNGDGHPTPKTQRSHSDSASKAARAIKRAAAETATTNKPRLIPQSADSTAVPSQDDRRIHLEYILSPTVTFSKWKLFGQVYADFLIIRAYPFHNRILSGWERMETTHFLTSITGWRVHGSPPYATYGDAANGFLTLLGLW
ncbi:MAG: hypothetical protein Q9173_001830 [Seirophora scorigena]